MDNENGQNKLKIPSKSFKKNTHVNSRPSSMLYSKYFQTFYNITNIFKFSLVLFSLLHIVY